jgi:hypothetical protein
MASEQVFCLGFRNNEAITFFNSSGNMNAILANAVYVPTTLSATKQNAQTIRGYLNGTLATSGNVPFNIAQGKCFYIGAQAGAAGCNGSVTANGRNVVNMVINSVRIYDRTLTSNEIANNTYVDYRRFIETPTVKIGTGICTNVVLTSSTQLQCTAPSGTAGENVAVSVTHGGITKTINSAYTYVANSSFYVTDINPTIGPTFGGTPMTFTGNNFGDNASNIVSVTIGGQPCVKRDGYFIAHSNTKYTCSVPILSTGGHKNVVATVQQGSITTSYTFINAYEYVVASIDPVKFNVG